jgi:hypothetical protein
MDYESQWKEIPNSIMHHTREPAFRAYYYKEVLES